jgi:uncharacterized membrane protein HdeD (DUF308 family)
MIDTILETTEQVVRKWYLLLIIGIILLAMGIWTLVTPVSSYLALSIIFAVGFFVNGLLQTFFAVANRSQNWGWSLVMGILGIILGLMLMFNPALSAITLPFYVGFMLLFHSVTGIGIALELKRQYVIDWGTLMALAVLGVVFSIILIFCPALAGISIVLWTGFAFLAMSFYSIYFSIRLRKLRKIVKKELGE